MAEMSKLKGMIMKGMNVVMLDCDKATFLTTKKDVDRLGCIQRTQLNLHLMGCKYCRAYARQSKIISEELVKEKNIDSNHFKIHLTSDQKNNLQKTVEENVE